MTFISRFYAGSLTTENCFSGASISISPNYSLSINELVEGAPVILTDENGSVWRGEMTSDASLMVARPDYDERVSIVLTEMTEESAYATVTDECVSFRCCNVFSGVLSVR